MLKLFGDYHTHSNYSDGGGTLAENVAAAKAAGLKEVAFTDHGYNNPYFCLTRKKAKKQCLAIQKLQLQEPEIVILQGIEADIISLDGHLDIRMEEIEEFDVLIAGFHAMARPRTLKDYFKYYRYAHRNMIRPTYTPPAHVVKRTTELFVKAIKKYPIDILPHINNYAKVDVSEIAKVCADYGTIIEINSKHIDIGLDDMDSILKTGVRIMANTDAHKPERIGDFNRIETFLASCNLSEDILVNKNKRPEFRSKR